MEYFKSFFTPAVQFEYPSLTQFLYRLSGVWFLSVAAGSILLSIPISAIGLPFILGCGVVVAGVGYTVKIILNIYWRLMRGTLRSIVVMMSPLSLVGLASSLISNLAPTETLLPVSRRFSASTITTEGLTEKERGMVDRINGSEKDRSEKWRYYSPSLTSPVLSNDSLDRALNDRTLGSIERHQTVYTRFLELERDSKDRIMLCRQLYSETTNQPVNLVNLRLGSVNDSVYKILTLWSEPNLNEPLLSEHLIGFCEYFYAVNCPETLHIDKLNVSPLYADKGFSKAIIRKLMASSPSYIHVWSVWHAESFYKHLGFRNVVDTTDEIRRGRKVEGKFGPFLVWSRDRTVLSSKDSMATLTGNGVGTSWE